jgi:type II secretion system protein G
MFRWKGFTLIELLIVVAIIAILAAIAVPNFLEAQTRSKVSRAKADMRTVATAIESYQVDHNKYPWTGGAQESRYAYLTTPVSYITSIPPDPFGTGQPGTFTMPTGYLGFYTYDFVVSYAPEIWWGAGAATYFVDLLKDAQISSPESKGWYLASMGPDRRVGLDVNNNPGYRAKPYDATNGTISPGDIHRVGP